MTRLADIPGIESQTEGMPSAPVIGAAAIAIRGVSWTISPDALRMYAPAMLNGRAAQVSEATLTIEFDGSDWGEWGGVPRATLRLCYGSEEDVDHTLPLPLGAQASITRDEAVGFEHVEIPGVLSMSLRTRDAGGTGRLLYAHSPLLGAIGLPGGVYDVPQLL